MAKKETQSVAPSSRVEAGLIEEDFEYQAREDAEEGLDLDAQAEALEGERISGAQNPTGVVLGSSSGLQNPNMSPEEQGMEMTPKTFGPPQYGSPDPATAASRLVTLEDGHPLDTVPEDHPSAISGDYAQDVLGVEQAPGTHHIADIDRHATGDFSVENNEQIDATDAARELANENSVDLNEVAGTGADGRVTKDDVENYIAENSGEES